MNSVWKKIAAYSIEIISNTIIIQNWRHCECEKYNLVISVFSLTQFVFRAPKRIGTLENFKRFFSKISLQIFSKPLDILLLVVIFL